MTAVRLLCRCDRLFDGRSSAGAASSAQQLKLRMLTRDQQPKIPSQQNLRCGGSRQARVLESPDSACSHFILSGTRLVSGYSRCGHETTDAGWARHGHRAAFPQAQGSHCAIPTSPPVLPEEHTLQITCRCNHDLQCRYQHGPSACTPLFS